MPTCPQCASTISSRTILISCSSDCGRCRKDENSIEYADGVIVVFAGGEVAEKLRRGHDDVTKVYAMYDAFHILYGQ